MNLPGQLASLGDLRDRITRELASVISYAQHGPLASKLVKKASTKHGAIPGIFERVVPTLNEQSMHRQRFDNIQHVARAVGDCISSYNQRRPYQELDVKNPAETFALAA